MASLSTFLAILEVLETQLPDLIEGATAAAELQTAIAPLKAQLQRGKDTRPAIRALLAQNSQIADYIATQSDGAEYEESEKGDFMTLGAPQRSFQGLPGASDWAQLVTPRKYYCPVPGCTFTWYKVGHRQPPLCDIHGEPLEPVD